MTGNNPFRRAPALAVAAALLPLAGLAQETPEASDPPDVLFVSRGSPVMALGAPIDIVAGQGSIVGEVIAGKPYTADAVTEFTQRLADGNRITHTNTARIYRDGAGRTRREHSLNSLGVWQATAGEPASMVVINDPVADTSYILDPAAKSARQMRPVKVAHDGEVDIATWEAAVPAPPPPGAPAGGVTVVVGAAGGPPETPPGAAPGTFEAPLPPAKRTMRAFTAVAAAPMIQPFAATDLQTEDLGEQDLQGVVTKGTRHTQVIPAGAIGNERAIEIVSEEWYSPDLETVVLRRNYDPRFGETTYQLVNVVRGEPSAELFTVPSDYDVTQGPAAFGAITRTEGPGGAPGELVEKRVLRIRPGADESNRD